jgi:glutathione S-transferase
VKAQGIGVHKPDEILEFGKSDLKVLSDMLADKPFFFGDEPTTVSIDCNSEYLLYLTSVACYSLMW